MNTCRCGHDIILHHQNGRCIALIMTLTTATAGCGCPEYRQQHKPKDKKK